MTGREHRYVLGERSILLCFEFLGKLETKCSWSMLKVDNFLKRRFLFFFQTKCLKIIFDRPRLLPAMKRSPRFRWPSSGRQKTAKTWRAAAISSSCRTSCRRRTRNELTWMNCRQNIQQLLPWPPIRSLHFCSRLVEAQTGAFLFCFSRARAESNTIKCHEIS